MATPQITWDEPQNQAAQAQVTWDEPQQPSAWSRFKEGAANGMGADNALSPRYSDPANQRPIADNPLIPGTGVYRDIKAHNYAGAAGRIVAPLAAVGGTLLGGRSEVGEPAPPAAPSEGSTLGKVAGMPLRYGARMAEAAVNQKIAPIKPLLKINTPADEAEAIHIKMPLRDIGLPKPSTSEGLPEIEAASPETAQHLRSTISQMRARIAQPGMPNRAEGLPEVEEGGPAAVQHLHAAVQRPLPARAVSAPPRVAPPTSPTGMAPEPIGEHWTPPAPKRDFAPNEGPLPGSKEDLENDRDVQADIRDRAENETDTLRKIGTEEGFARNTRQRTPKSVLTGTEKPVKLTTTPSAAKAKIAKPNAAASGKEIPAEDLNNPEVLKRKLDESVAAVNKKKTKE